MPTTPRTPDLLSLLQMVESAPPSDLDWARHCTRQQAVLLRLHLPGGEQPATCDQVAEATGIPIWTDPSLPTPSRTLLAEASDGNAVILLSADLGHDERLRACLRELKRLIDLPARLRMNADAFADDTYDILADHFADLVLEEHGP